MQLSNIFTVLAVAMTATALPAAEPADVVARTDTTCTNNQKQVCCTGGLLGNLLDLTCVVNILGNQCSGSSYCCDTNAAQGGLVNINALNCVKIL